MGSSGRRREDLLGVVVGDRLGEGDREPPPDLTVLPPRVDLVRLDSGRDEHERRVAAIEGVVIHRVEDVTEFVRLQNEQITTEQVKMKLLAKSPEMEIEIVKRSKEIQKLNEGLEQKVAEGTSSLEILHRDPHWDIGH